MPDSGPLDLSALELGCAALLLLANGAVSVWLGLGLGSRLLWAGVRTVVQLSLLGVVLVFVFDAQEPLLVVGIGSLMLLMAAREAVRRAGRRYRGVYGHAFLSLMLASGVSILLATLVVLRPDPWWQPRYLIPLLGMVLGNGLTGISLGLDRCLLKFDEGRGEVEVWLAAGATPWEAARPTASEAIRAGLIPILNAMSVVGLVTIPGMMTGQILGGSDPSLAARYQILVMFLIAGVTAAGTTGCVLFAVRSAFDEGGRLRPERISKVG
ncbi:MAG: iron export ABC transporter permease subunit FetB [bacterium]|jgi:putative ABC transport system permease protein|nr:iron export ABC transporter permease subunit FetB [Planctomycetota bacterium]HIL51796.1 iron export ABC transporter permease subunit FetB [Planctomycetota bacterium]